MSDAANGWYVVGEGGRSTHPFSHDEIAQLLQQGRLRPDSLCWREGLPEWLPLEEVEPFGSELAAARRAAHRVFARRAGYTVLALLVVGLAVYIVAKYRREAAILDQARAHIAAHGYDAAIAQVSPLRGTAWFYGRDSEYLYAVAVAWQCATAQDAPSTDGALDDVAERFERLFQADPSLRDRAQADLAKLPQGVPPASPRFAARLVDLAEFLGRLELIEAAPAAKLLLAELQTAWQQSQRGPQAADGVAVRWIVDHDRSLTGDVLEAIVSQPDGHGSPLAERLALLPLWTQDNTAISQQMATALLARAKEAAGRDDYELAHDLLTAAAQLWPDQRETYVRKQLEWLKYRASQGQAAEVLGHLQQMEMGKAASPLKAAAAVVAVAAAQSLATKEPSRAGEALRLAFAWDRALEKREDLAWLRLRSHPAGEVGQLAMYEKLLADFPDSTRRAEAEAAIARLRAEQRSVVRAPEPRVPRRPFAEMSDPPASGDHDSPAPRVTPPPPGGPLSGVWESSLSKDRFQIDDDGKTLNFRLQSGNPRQSMEGSLSRKEATPEHLIGTCAGVFPPDAPARHTISVTGSINGPDSLRLRFTKWPKWAGGKLAEDGIVNDTWTRQP